jgi:hypothetical protein
MGTIAAVETLACTALKNAHESFSSSQIKVVSWTAQHLQEALKKTILVPLTSHKGEVFDTMPFMAFSKECLGFSMNQKINACNNFCKQFN